jgi:hypothetical protein
VIIPSNEQKTIAVLWKIAKVHHTQC